MDLWGEIKFWFDRYRAWVLVGLGFIVLTLAFLLISRFSADSDRQMARQAEEVEEVQEVIQEQQFEILGDSRFSEEVNALPTETEIISFLETKQEELGDNNYLSNQAMELIREEFGDATRNLAEEGYILSDTMTAENRVIVQLFQEQLLYAMGQLEDEDVLTFISFETGGFGIPKPLYEVRKPLGEGVRITNYTIGVFNMEEKEASETLLFAHSTHTGELDMAYTIPEGENLGDVSLVGGYVAKGGIDTGEKAIYAYLYFKPNYAMTGEEYANKLDELDVQINGFTVDTETTKDIGKELLVNIPMLTEVQMTDGFFNYTDSEGYNESDSVTLTINNKEIDIITSGIDFEYEIYK